MIYVVYSFRFNFKVEKNQNFAYINCDDFLGDVGKITSCDMQKNIH